MSSALWPLYLRSFTATTQLSFGSAVLNVDSGQESLIDPVLKTTLLQIKMEAHRGPYIEGSSLIVGLSPLPS